MARTALPVQRAPLGGGIQNVVFTAADAANGMIMPNDGRTVIVIRNNDVAAKTVTIVSVPDENNRNGDIALIVPAAAGGKPGIGISDVLPTALFNQQNADVGNVYLNFSAAANLDLAAISLG